MAFRFNRWAGRSPGRLVVAVVVCLTAEADVQLFRIDPARSPLALQGTTAGVAWHEQGPGGLEVTAGGWLVAELTADTIHFIAGSRLTALATNVWQPGAPGVGALADFGGSVTVGTGLSADHQVAALRQLALDVSGSPVALADGHFDAGAVNLAVPVSAGTVLDYRANGLLVVTGRKELGGATAPNAAHDGIFTRPLNPDLGMILTLPVDGTLPTLRLPAGETVLRLTGSIVATHSGFVLDPVLLVVPSTDGARQFTLVWDSRYHLQTRARLDAGGWVDSPAQAPLVVTFDGAEGYFRVVSGP